MDAELRSLIAFLPHARVFMQHMQSFLPVLSRHVISESDVYHTRKVLSLAIIAITSGIVSPEKQPWRQRTILEALEECVVQGRWSSLELIDALLLMAAWTWPKARGQALSHQYLHMAAAMAMDLDTDRRSSRLTHAFTAESAGSVERKRAFLSCYILCSE